LNAYQSGTFSEKSSKLTNLLKNCQVCPRNCRVNRLNEEVGDCQVGYEPIISSHFPHFGEEAPLVGSRGSGTIFMAGCNLKCLFCQNYETSHMLEGSPVNVRHLGQMMLALQESGCHNINIVTPSHIVPQMIEALGTAIEGGLKIPLVYNSSGYDSMKSLKLLDGLVDIYMPDFKFFSDALAARYTGVDDYATIAKEAIREMHRQVGELVIEDGIAVRGLLIRHLVMPGYLEESEKILNFIAEELSLDTYVNIMPQYRPAGRAYQFDEINRPLTYPEFLGVITIAKNLGFTRLDKDN
jgi:putative pyruvate formate lyase activating enzyme